MRHQVSGVPKVLGVFAVLALSAACGGRSKGLAPYVTALDKPVNTMTLHELWLASEKIGHWNHGPEQPRKCGGMPMNDCQARFDAVPNQLPAPGNVSVNGTIVARIVNVGGPGGVNRGEESRYKAQLRGGKRHFLLIAQSDGAGGWSWSVREARKNRSALSTPLASGNWEVCTLDRTLAGHPQGESQFAKCPHRPPGPSPMSTMYDTFDPGWLHCMSSGCCTAGN